MNDKLLPFPPLGQQIRALREQRGWTLAELARRAGTSGPALHRYENGWDRFGLATLRRIGAALDARLEIRLVPAASGPAAARRPSGRTLAKMLAPLFWERALRESDLAEHAGWALERVLTSGSREQVRATRAFFGDEAVRSAAERRGVDPRTRHYWRLILGRSDRAPQSPRR
jgi:transcriptional regulator with XRE-family HTH domain